MQALRDDITHLASIDRLPCSPGEHEAAEWIAGRLREAGARVRVEEERVHGTYFAPVGLLNAVALAGGLAALQGRRAGGLLGALAAAALWQDLTGGPRRWFRRRLPHRPTWNVVADLGDPSASRTLVVHAHHDAARTSFIFDQAAPRFVGDRLPWLLDRLDRWPPLMAGVVLGPLLVAAGALAGRRRLAAAGTAAAAATASLMAHMSRQPVVPGANDNLTGVAVLLEVARRLQGRVPGIRVILLSAGAEESNQDGMLAYARRHFGELPKETTTFLCLDTVGSSELLLIEGEGFLRMYDYPDATKELIAEAARDRGVHIRRGLKFTFATDGLVPLRAGYPVASIGSVNEYLVPANYHWPTDTADNVDYRTVADCTELVLAVVDRLDR